MQKINKCLIGLLVSLASFQVFAGDDGLIHKVSRLSVSETADKFTTLAQQYGLNVIERIDHQENAKKVGMKLRPTELIIFGNPKAGTPLMLCNQTIAIDLPQKALIYEDQYGKTIISYNDPMYLKKRHALQECDDALSKVSGVLDKLTTDAAN